MKYRESILGILVFVLFVLSLILNYKPKSTVVDVSLSSSTLFPQKSIAVLDIFGPIAFPQYSSALTPLGANAILEQLYAIKEDDNIKGLLVRINSPGGTVAASQEIYEAIKSVKAELNIPIVAQIGDVGASGAYYAALGADTIFANRGSLVGSIGVIIGNLSVHELAKEYGLDYQVYKSGPYKDILSMWRPSTQEEDQLIQSLVDNVYEQFKSDFVDSRKVSHEHAAGLAQDALTYIGELTGLGPNPPVISKVSYGFTDVFNLLNNSFKGSLQGAFSYPELR